MRRNHLLACVVVATIACLVSNCNKENNYPEVLSEGMPGQMGHCSLIGSDGFLYIVGKKTNDKLLILKTDLVGNKVWEKSYDFLGPMTGNSRIQILETNDHNFLVSAFAQAKYNPGYLLKMDGSGDSLWTYQFPDNKDESFIATAQMTDSSILVARQESISYETNMFNLVNYKISPHGELVMMKNYLDTAGYVQLFDWQTNADGNVVFTGSRNNFGILIEISPALEIVNSEVIDEEREYFNFSNSEGQFIGGNFFTNTIILPLAKVVPGGDAIWERDYSMPSTEWTDLYYIYIIPGGYMLTGALWYEGSKGYKTSNPFCMQIDEDGNQVKFWDNESDLPGYPYNFHYVAEDYYLMVGFSKYSILVWRLDNTESR